MGDSITEGTIVEWCVPPGSSVREGDVLCLVETDKVTVDIKADKDGILIRQLGEVEGVVEVGQGLYVMETDAGAAISATSAVMDAVSAVDASLDAGIAAASAATSPSSHSPARKKSIQFLGKEGWRARMTMIDDVVAPPAVAPTTTAATTTTTMFPTSSGRPNAPTSITHIPYSPMLGRPTITDEEMMALMLGGADEAPNVMGGGGSKGSFAGGKIVTAGPRGVWLAD
jgi:pyruvate/2-oxoglutarate dehydrogenase complex dihydrolipoamide acyltransferase (E2) component